MHAAWLALKGESIGGLQGRSDTCLSCKSKCNGPGRGAQLVVLLSPPTLLSYRWSAAGRSMPIESQQFELPAFSTRSNMNHESHHDPSIRDITEEAVFSVGENNDDAEITSECASSIACSTLAFGVCAHRDRYLPHFMTRPLSVVALIRFQCIIEAPTFWGWGHHSCGDDRCVSYFLLVLFVKPTHLAYFQGSRGISSALISPSFFSV